MKTRVALIGALLTTAAISPVQADQGGIPPQVAALQNDVQILRQQVRKLIEQAKTQNIAITQLTAAIKEFPPAWDRTLPASDGDPNGCNSSRFTCVMPDAAFPDGSAVRDNETGLVWDRAPALTPPSTQFWSDARQMCMNKTVSGRRGWRLPSVHELASLLDDTQINPALPTGHPFNINIGGYYSATTDSTIVNGGLFTSVWTVDLGVAGVRSNGNDIGGHVWCVRGGGPLSTY